MIYIYGHYEAVFFKWLNWLHPERMANSPSVWIQNEYLSWLTVFGIIIIITSRLDMCRREFVSDDCNRGTAGKSRPYCDLQLLLWKERNESELYLTMAPKESERNSLFSLSRPSLSLASVTECRGQIWSSALWWRWFSRPDGLERRKQEKGSPCGENENMHWTSEDNNK